MPQPLRRADPYAPQEHDEYGRPLHLNDAVKAIRKAICYPALIEEYGEVAVRGARLFFDSPRNIEDMLFAVKNGRRATPLCDNWRKAKLAFEPQEAEL